MEFRVYLGMFAPTTQKQVLDAIVHTVEVDMVHHLVTGEPPA